jgi:hypothetical protein
VSFFSSLIEGKDEHIAKLGKHLESLHQKKKEQNMQLLQLREMVMKVNSQYEGRPRSPRPPQQAKELLHRHLRERNTRYIHQ